MENALLIGLSRQVALRRELDVVANNIANLNTTGFKADAAVFEEFLMPVARADQFQLPDRRLSFVQDRATWHDLGQGPMQLNAAGELVTSAGDRVLGDGGPITLLPGDRDVTISADGTVSVREGANATIDAIRGRVR